MINNKDLQNELIRLSNLKILIETYEEVAANRMRKNRSAVLESRAYNEGLGHMYQEIKGSYRTQLETLVRQKRTGSGSLIKRNGKTVCLLISSNAGLYGEIIPRLTDQFVAFIKRVPSDLAIVGRLGRRLFEERGLTMPFTFFDIPDTNVDPLEVEKLANFLIEYEKIYIFYGKFISVGVQQPTMLDVVGEEELEEAAEGKSEVEKTASARYLFEPSLERIMIFFEQQIFTSLVQAAVKESELAKFASRMITLDSATENVKTALSKNELQQRIFTHRTQNKKQQELLYGVSLWNK